MKQPFRITYETGQISIIFWLQIKEHLPRKNLAFPQQKPLWKWTFSNDFQTPSQLRYQSGPCFAIAVQSLKISKIKRSGSAITIIDLTRLSHLQTNADVRRVISQRISSSTLNRIPSKMSFSNIRYCKLNQEGFPCFVGRVFLCQITISGFWSLDQLSLAMISLALAGSRKRF